MKKIEWNVREFLTRQGGNIGITATTFGLLAFLLALAVNLSLLVGATGNVASPSLHMASPPTLSLVSVAQAALPQAVVPEVVASAVPVVRVAEVAPKAPETIDYLVQPGDTLTALAKQFCVADYRVIARDSNLTNPNRIYAGKTPLRIKNGCPNNAPSVLAKQSVSPRELTGDGRASSGKRISKVKAPELPAATLPLTVAAPASAPAPAASQPTQASVAAPPAIAASQPTPVEVAAVPAASQSQPVPAVPSAKFVADPRPLSVILHREIYRVVALRRLGKDRSRAQGAELGRLQMLIRREVLARYPLKNADCLYETKVGRNWEEQTLFRVSCLRENYGDVLRVVAEDTKLSVAYLEAVMVVESGGQPDAISPTGCTGTKQFTLGSAKLFGLPDRFDPFESIRAGGRHLQDNLRMWNGNVAKATAHYNIGSIVVGAKGFNAAKFPYTQAVLRVQRLIETKLPFTTSSVSHQAAPTTQQLIKS